MEQLISVRELAEAWGVPPSWVYQRSESGDLPRIKVGRYVRFRRAEVEEWLEDKRRRAEVVTVVSAEPVSDTQDTPA